MIYEMTKFDVPAQNGFWFTWKSVFDHLCKQIHDVKIITFVVFCFESERVGKEGEQIWKLYYLKNKKRAF